MLYVLYGDDEFSIREELAALRERVTPEEMRDSNVTALSGADATFNQVAQACYAVPFMANKRLVSVDGLLGRFETRGRGGGTRGRGARAALGQWDGLDGLLPGFPPTTDLVFVDGPLAETNPLLVKVRQHATLRGFRTPRGDGLRRWILDRAASQGMAVSPDAAAELADSVGGNLRVIASELEKLAVYRWRETVSRDDVRRVVVYSRDANIFQTVDAVIEGRASAAMAQVLRTLDSGAAPAFIIAMLARQVRHLLLAKEMRGRGLASAEIGRALGIPEFAARRVMGQESRLSFEQLSAMHRELLEADVSIKRGEAGERLAVEMLAASLVAVSRERVGRAR